jgi:hypothetical protein
MGDWEDGRKEEESRCVGVGDEWRTMKAEPGDHSLVQLRGRDIRGWEGMDCDNHHHADHDDHIHLDEQKTQDDGEEDTVMES